MATTTYTVTLTATNNDWRRGKHIDIADTFDNTEPEGEGPYITFTYTTTIDGVSYTGITPEQEAYRLARNHFETQLETHGLTAKITNLDIEKTETDRPTIDTGSLTPDNIKNWSAHEGDPENSEKFRLEHEWTHDHSDQWLAIAEDHEDCTREWHSERHYETNPWAVTHKFTTIARKETLDEALESALTWMTGNPYGLDPANRY